ncbi:FGGY family of carbohydrate kinases, N-terminal domain [Thermoclostridium caenicola]|uniref:FGGY family of carbohydrate kinases, N-terminal domain n=1 Tax=Thermoclostridium caenicola TaxID=659425 RepID=A0A1M6HJJ6_9FIRM|nr:FGGY family of carbohydrate kinases, N-terminal domain [Thermoclostridium caenicola]
MAYLLGIDIGTSGTKTVLFDEKGTTIASDTQEYPLYQPKNGWAEQDPEDWWKATCVSTRNVLAKSGVDPREIKGIGLSGQMHGLVLLDRDNKVLRRSIIWCDQRSALECEQITSIVGAERLIEITANPALTGFTASKIKWVMNNEPEIYEKARKILLPKDYIRFCLTGEYATEVSDASGMQLLDVPNRKWSDEILEKLGIDKDMLGKVYESPEVTGRVTKKAAELTGLAEGTIVVGGGGDQAAGAVGNGIVKPGIISSTIGTIMIPEIKTDKTAKIS